MEPFVDGGGGPRARRRKRQPASHVCLSAITNGIMYVCSKVL